MSLALNPISGGYVHPKGWIFARFEGNDFFEELGNAESFGVTVETERDDLPDNRFGTKVIVDSEITDKNVTVAFVLRQMTDRSRALAVGGSLLYLNQEAGSGTLEIENAVAGQHYFMGALGVTAVTATDGAAIDPEDKEIGTDYMVDGKAGMFQPLTAGKFSVAFTIPSVADADKRLKTGIAGNPNTAAEVVFVGTNRKGPRPYVRLWNVRMNPAGERSYISEDRGTVEIEGTALADPVKALAEDPVNTEEYLFGYETTVA